MGLFYILMYNEVRYYDVCSLVSVNIRGYYVIHSLFVCISKSPFSRSRFSWNHHIFFKLFTLYTAFATLWHGSSRKRRHSVLIARYIRRWVRSRISRSYEGFLRTWLLSTFPSRLITVVTDHQHFCFILVQIFEFVDVQMVTSAAGPRRLSKSIYECSHSLTQL